MASSTVVLSAPEFTVRVVRCAARTGGWSAPEPAGPAGLVLPRRGMFRIRGEDGRRHTVDPTMGYLQAPGREYRFAHPAGGDVCTSITLGEPLWHRLLGEPPPAAPSVPVRVDARLELAHRLLLRTRADAADPAERLVRVLGAAVREQRGRAPAPGRADLADLAREAILAGDPDAADLVRLAGSLGVSPAHLSRTFHRHVGMTIGRYRNRVRVGAALARLDGGETDLAALAAAAGFADQAHLTRTVRAQVGHTPGDIRRLFATTFCAERGV